MAAAALGAGRFSAGADCGGGHSGGRGARAAAHAAGASIPPVRMFPWRSMLANNRLLPPSLS